MATVKEQVGEVLLGSTDEPQLSQLTRAAFLKYAQKDESGDYYLSEDQFIDAVAPESEDFVSSVALQTAASKLTMMRFLTAQNQTLPVQHSLCCSRPRQEGQGQPPGLVCLPEPPCQTRCRVRGCLPLLRQEQNWLHQL